MMKKIKQIIKTKKQRVYAKYWKERLGSIVVEGPEVSEVEWDDASKADRFISNEQLVKIK